MENDMDTEKKPEEPEKSKQNVGDIVGDLVVSGATVLANTAAKAVVSRVKKAAAKSKPAKGRCKSRKDGKEVVRCCQDSEEQESQKIWR
jgi:hypothetical protein